MNRDLVSIVLPTFNRVSDLKRAVLSVREQTYQNWELIIVDNFSTDGTEDFVRGLGDSRVSLRKTHNEGVVAVSRNVGMEAVRGQYVAFLDSDDWWTIDKLDKCVAAMSQGADVVYHDLYLVKGNNQVHLRPTGSARQVQGNPADDLLHHGNALLNSSVVVRASVLKDVGPQCEDRVLVGAEDFDLWVRLGRRTDRFQCVPWTLGYYWAGGGNMTSPSRVLTYLDALEAKYLVLRSRAWFAYSRTQAHYRLGQYDQARREALALLRAAAPMRLWPRLFYILIMSGVKRVLDPGGSSARRAP